MILIIMAPFSSNSRVILEHKGGYYLLTLPNRLHFQDSDALLGVYEHLKKKEGRHQLAVDLNQTVFLDSRSLGQLARIGSLLRASSGRMATVGANPKLSEMFNLTQLGDFLETYPDFGQLQSAFSPGAEVTGSLD